MSQFDVFGDSVAIQLKRMPEHTALILQEKIQSLLTAERVSQLAARSDSLAQSSSSKRARAASPFGDGEAPPSRTFSDSDLEYE